MYPLLGDPLGVVPVGFYPIEPLFYWVKMALFVKKWDASYLSLVIFIWFISLEFSLFEGTGSKADIMNCLRPSEQCVGIKI